MKSQLIQNKHQSALRVEKLDTVSPLSTLKRGYSITKNNDGELITQVEQLKSGQEISTTFANGTVRSIVK